jgi:hypothetical protein
MKDEYNEVGSNTIDLNAENTIQKSVFGFTNIDVDGEERLQYLHCMNILAAEAE